MEAVNSLTISSVSGTLGAASRAALGAAGVLVILVPLSLGGCTIEVGPPPESDPALVPQSAKAPTAPSQPTEPQAWSRDLDFTTGSGAIDHKELEEGLVASNSGVAYSGQRLTYESAFASERPPTEAELALKRAKERAAAAGTIPPPRAVAAPVEEVNQQSLPPVGEPQPVAVEAKLPEPPEVPSAPADASDQVEVAAAPQPPLPVENEIPPVEESSAAALEATTTPTEPSEAQLTPPEKMAALPPSEDGPLKPAEAPASVPGDSSTAAFLAEAWDAPAGTILVQVSAVQEEAKVIDEWQRLQGHYPQVLKPLRLVIDEAKVGDRGVFYRIQAGAFVTEEGAVAACDNLISQGQSCFVLVR